MTALYIMDRIYKHMFSFLIIAECRNGFLWAFKFSYNKLTSSVNVIRLISILILC